MAASLKESAIFIQYKKYKETGEQCVLKKDLRIGK